MYDKNGFSEYEANFPELRKDWWMTRSHRSGCDFFPKEFKQLLDALAHYEEYDDVKALDGVVHAIKSFPRTVPSASKIGFNSGQLAKILLRRAAGNQFDLTNFYRALDSLLKLCSTKPEWTASHDHQPAPTYVDVEGVTREVPGKYRDW